MKNLKFVGLSMMILAAAACTEPAQTKKEPVLQPIKSVIAMDGKKEVAAKIDHLEKTIKFESFVNTDDMSAVEVKIEVAEGAKLVSPSAVATVDLTKDVKVVVNNNVKDLEYVMTADKPVLNPIKEAGFDVAEEFGALPEHIKVYKSNKLGTNKDESGWIVEIKKGATLSLAGNGSTGSATCLKDVVKAQKGWNIYMNGICGMKSCNWNDGKYNYSSGSTFGAFAVTKDGKFQIAPQKRFQKADKSYTISKLDAKGKVVKEDWGAELQLAMGGTAVMVLDGQVLSAEEQKATDGGYSFGWWNGNAAHAREALGVNKEGTAAYFFICGNDHGGLSMKQVQDLMVQIKSHSVLFMEGSHSANIFVNGQQTWKNNDGSKAASNIIMVK